MLKKKMARKFLSQFSWVFVGNLLFALSQWLVLVIITKSGNDLDLGYYTYALAIISPVFLFFTLDLRRVLATSEISTKLFHTYFLNRVLHVNIAFIILLIFTVIFIEDKVLSLVVILLSLLKVIEYLSDIIFGYFQQLSLSDLIGKSQLLRSVIFILVFGTGYIITTNLIFTLLLLNIAMLLRLLLYDVKKSKLDINLLRSILQNKELEVKTIALSNTTLGITLLVDSLTVNVPRYLLEYNTDIIIVGYFSSIYYIIVAASLVITPVTIMLSPILRRLYDLNKKELWRFLKRTYIFSGLLSLLTIIVILPFSKEVLAIFYNENIVGYSLVFDILLFTVIFQLLNAINGLVLIMINKKRVMMRISIINFVIVLILGSVLIYIKGIIGASFTILIVRITMFVFTIGVIKKDIVSK